MRNGFWKSICLATFALALAASAEDKKVEKPHVVMLPVTGLVGDCCNSAVADAILGLDAQKIVKGVAWKEEGKTKWAMVTLNWGAMELSKVEEALAAATKAKGKDKGTEYKIDYAAVRVDASVYFWVTAPTEEETTALNSAFAALKGFESIDLATPKGGRTTLGLKFREKESASLELVLKILKDAKVDVLETHFLGAN